MLFRSYDLAIARIDVIKGTALNLGGGPDNTLAIWSEFGPLLAELKGTEIPVVYGPWRPGDQRVFIADIRRAEQQLDWRPEIPPPAGIRDLYTWVSANRSLFS